MIYDIARALSSQLHTPVPLAHHTYHKENKNIMFTKNHSTISKIDSKIFFVIKNILEIIVQYHHRLLTNYLRTKLGQKYYILFGWRYCWIFEARTIESVDLNTTKISNNNSHENLREQARKFPRTTKISDNNHVRFPRTRTPAE